MDNNNNNITTGKNKKRGRGATRVAVVLAMLLIASVAGGYFLFKDSDQMKAGLKDANSQIKELQLENAKLKIELDTTKQNLRREKEIRANIEHENDTLKTMFPIFITSMEIANCDGNGAVISDFGKPISASNSMFLMPRITYVGLRGGLKAELLVRLYDHEGKLVTGASSPVGYSYSFTLNPIEPNENRVRMSGWGGADRGHFPPGTYRYEVWLGDMCLKQKVFTLR